MKNIMSGAVKILCLTVYVLLAFWLYGMYFLFYFHDAGVFSSWQIPLICFAFLVLGAILIYNANSKPYIYSILCTVIAVIFLYFASLLPDFKILRDRMTNEDISAYREGSYSYVNETWCAEEGGHGIASKNSAISENSVLNIAFLTIYS